MKKYLFVFIIAVTVLCIPADKLNTNEHEVKSRFASDHVIVKLKKNSFNLAASLSPSGIYECTLTELFNSLDLNITKTKKLFPEDRKNKNILYTKYEFETYYAVYFDGSKNIPDVCSRISENKKVDFCEPDFIGEAAGRKGIQQSAPPNDEFFKRQWGLYNDGTQKTTGGKSGKRGADMNVLKAWDISSGSEDIIVAILDSGAKTDHPDLSARIWVNKGEIKNGRDDDGNGFVDDIYGYNFAYDNSNVKDDGGHGTNISGTVGAVTNNDLGYAGIDQKCRLMICKNLDDDNLGEYSWWAASLYYAANNGAHVINMSEGGYDYSKTLENAINYAFEAGSLIVASMMNKNNGDSYYPASFKNVMAIGATDADDSRCREFTWGGGSNWGKHISVVAPGNKIYGLDFKDNYNYDVYWSGTSQATAYVSGIASVLLGQDPSRTNSDLRVIITSTAIDRVGDTREDKQGWDQYYGHGRVDLYEALNYGRYSSGKKEEKKTKTSDEVEDSRTNEGNNNGESTRAKANDPGYDNRDKRNEDNDSDRAIKPKPDKP
jgi:thermitase